MKTTLYLDNGYLDVSKLVDDSTPFNILIGGRGIGKTYGLLKYYYEANDKIIYLRRTAEEAKLISSPSLNPYKRLMEDINQDFTVTKSNPRAVVTQDKEICLMMGLSTISHIRGFDASDIQAIVYDEFIPEMGVKKLKNEAESLLNAYETINRNREINGLPPVFLWLVSNSNTLNNPILRELGVLDTVRGMCSDGVEITRDLKRGLKIVICRDSPISDKKEETALYKLVRTDYKNMALKNEFRDDLSHIVSLSLKTLTPVVGIGNLIIYRRKDRKGYYISTHQSGSIKVYGTGPDSVKNFLRQYGYILQAYYFGYLYFESLEIEYDFRGQFDM